MGAVIMTSVILVVSVKIVLITKYAVFHPLSALYLLMRFNILQHMDRIQPFRPLVQHLPLVCLFAHLRSHSSQLGTSGASSSLTDFDREFLTRVRSGPQRKRLVVEAVQLLRHRMVLVYATGDHGGVLYAGPCIQIVRCLFCFILLGYPC